MDSWDNGFWAPGAGFGALLLKPVRGGRLEQRAGGTTEDRAVIDDEALHDHGASMAWRIVPRLPPENPSSVSTNSDDS